MADVHKIKPKNIVLFNDQLFYNNEPFVLGIGYSNDAISKDDFVPGKSCSHLKNIFFRMQNLYGLETKAYTIPIKFTEKYLKKKEMLERFNLSGIILLKFVKEKDLLQPIALDIKTPFDETIKNYESEISALKEENALLKKKNTELQTELDYSPYGDGYLETEKHFQELLTSS